MKRFFGLIAVLLALCAPAFALDIPPAPTQWLTDSAGMLTPDQASALNEKLRAFEQQSGAQFIIYTMPSLQGEALEDFTIRCAEKWKVGQKKYDNGLILFVFRDERKVRVEVGYGLEGTITDAFSSDVIRNYIAPHFQQGDYAGGLNAAADAVIARISGKEAPVPPLNPTAGGGAAQQLSGRDLMMLLFLIMVVLFVVAPLARRGGCGCGGCFLPMFFGGGGTTFGGGGFSGGGGGGFGGFSGGGGGFGGGGASGGW